MLGASLSEVWGEDFKIKKKKKNKNITPPMSPDEMDSELLINPSEKTKFQTNEYNRHKLLRDDRFIEDSYKPVTYANSNIVNSTYPYGHVPKKIEDDPDYLEFIEYKKMKYHNRKTNKDNNLIQNNPLQKISTDHQLNELILYIFTGFFLLLLYDNIYRFGKKSY